MFTTIQIAKIAIRFSTTIHSTFSFKRNDILKKHLGCKKGESKKVQVIEYLNQNSQAVKKECGPQKGQGEKRCEIQGGGQEMAVMVG